MCRVCVYVCGSVSVMCAANSQLKEDLAKSTFATGMNERELPKMEKPKAEEEKKEEEEAETKAGSSLKEFSKERRRGLRGNSVREEREGEV